RAKILSYLYFNKSASCTSIKAIPLKQSTSSIVFILYKMPRCLQSFNAMAQWFISELGKMTPLCIDLKVICFKLLLTACAFNCDHNIFSILVGYLKYLSLIFTEDN